MKIKETNMTIGEFIAKMSAGWGFWRGGTNQDIGFALDKAVPAEIRNVPVKVRFMTGHYGWGPNAHQTYRWEVEGIEIPNLPTGRLGPSSVDLTFGYTREMLPCLSLTPEGFAVSYEW